MRFIIIAPIIYSIPILRSSEQSAAGSAVGQPDRGQTTNVDKSLPSSPVETNEKYIDRNSSLCKEVSTSYIFV